MMSTDTKSILSFLLILQFSFHLVIAFNNTDIQFADIFPKIINNDTQITLNVGDSLAIKCQCLHHITWRHFNTTKLSDAHLTPNLFNFESTLYLRNISVHDVGYYYCMLTDTISGLNLDQDLEYAHELREASRIYVYVNDQAYPLVPTINTNIRGKLFSKVVLPCKPSSESFEVELLLKREMSIDNPKWNDSKIGFTMELIDSSLNPITLICQSKGAVKSAFEINVTIEPYVNFINIPVIQQRPSVELYANRKNYIILYCSVEVKKSDKIEIKWKNKSGEFPKNWRSETTTTNHSNSVELVIQWNQIIIENATYDDRGLYICTAQNIDTKAESNRSTYVDIWFKYKPVLTTIQDYYIKAEENVTVNCKCQANPSCSIRWTYDSCQPSENSNCSVTSTAELHNQTLMFYNAVILQSTITFRPPSSGIVHCSGKNLDLETIQDIHIWLDDLDTQFEINGANVTETVLIGDNVTVTCAASIYNHTLLDWYLDSRKIDSNDDYEVVQNDTQYSMRKQLTIKNISTSGLYECRTVVRHTGELRIDVLRTGFSDRKFINITPEIAQPVEIEGAKNSTQEFSYGEPLVLHCNASGVPKPKITWYMDNREIPFDPKKIHNSNMTLNITDPRELESGYYGCEASNRNTRNSKYTTVVILTDYRTITIPILAITLVLLFFLVIHISVRLHRARKANKNWKKLAENWVKGEPGKFDPKLLLSEQAASLPYDKEKYEISEDDVELGYVLGAGEFGQVRKGYALINGYNHTVAVKEIKSKNAQDYEEIEALATELKIMSNLKEHMNIVNLLAAVTNNFAEREFMIVMEYCKYGNLHNILRSNRNSFINQFDPTTHELNPSIVSLPAQHWNGYDQWTNSSGISSLCTTDLIQWAFQVACGMQFLAENNVLHGDLATRNILLYDDNTVKICDFGLSRTLDKDKTYLKTKGKKVPWLILSPESLAHRIFNTSTDVWAFGIVLWELFSLGNTPFEEFANASQLADGLRNGDRFKKPAFANENLFKLMLQCTEYESKDRTTFQNLQNDLLLMLPDIIVENYKNKMYTYQEWIQGFFKKGQPAQSKNLQQSLSFEVDECKTRKEGQKLVDNNFIGCLRNVLRNKKG